MAPEMRGSVFRTTSGWGIRWPEGGRRPQQTGFRTKTEARAWFGEQVAPRLRRGAPTADLSFDEFAAVFLERHNGAPRTKQTLAERLAPAREQFGEWPLRELEGASGDIAAWRAGLRPTSRYRLTAALRQALGAAVRWGYLASNPALAAGRNPEPRAAELRPFTREQVDALALELGRVYGPLVIFAAETGLRTSEWLALERRDLDRAGRAVTVQRRYSAGALTGYPKTERSRRRVPLSARALAALDSLPARLDTPLVFPAPRGGYLALDNWRVREWYPALEAAGLARRGPYCLRHTFATEALAAGISTFELARVMGTSLAMIDKTYGHLARDSEASIRARLDARASEAAEQAGKK